MSVWDDLDRRRRAYDNTRTEAQKRAAERIAAGPHHRIKTVLVYQDEFGWWRCVVGSGGRLKFRARSVDELIDTLPAPVTP